jgi:flagellar hook-length control protein FliK
LQSPRPDIEAPVVSQASAEIYLNHGIQGTKTLTAVHDIEITTVPLYLQKGMEDEKANAETEPASQTNVQTAEARKSTADGAATIPSQQKISLEHKRAEKLSSSLEATVKLSSSDLPAIDSSPSGAQIETNNIRTYTGTQNVSEATTTFDLPKVQVEVKTGQPEIPIKNMPKQVSADQFVMKNSRRVPDIPLVSADVSAYAEAESIKTQTMNQIFADATTNLDLPILESLQSGTDVNKNVVHVERQVVQPLATISQLDTQFAEEIEPGNVVDPKSENNLHNAISTASAQKLGNLQAASVYTAKAAFDGSSPLPTADNKEPRVSFHTNTSLKVDPGQQDLRADQAPLTDEKMLPVEEQHEFNGLLKSAPSTTGSGKEAGEVGSVEKGQTREIDMNTAELVDQVVHQLNGRLKSGPTSMHLQLNPEELGAIDVELIRDSQGVSVTFYAEHSSTGKLLETQLSQLRQSLMDSGVQLSGLNIGQHNHSRQEGGFPHQNTYFARSSPREAPSSRANTNEHPHPTRVAGQLSEVDYLI